MAGVRVDNVEAVPTMEDGSFETPFVSVLAKSAAAAVSPGSLSSPLAFPPIREIFVVETAMALSLPTNLTNGPESLNIFQHKPSLPLTSTINRPTLPNLNTKCPNARRNLLISTTPPREES